MIRITVRIQDATAKWLEDSAKKRKLEVNGKLAIGKFLDLLVGMEPGSAPENPADGATEERQKTVYIAEELETLDGLLKIARDDEGSPIGFVRMKVTDGWQKIDWKKLGELSVEVQGLKRDKLSEEVKLKRAQRTRIENRLPVTARNRLEMEKDTAEPGAGFPKWCMRDKCTVDSPEELEAHEASGCKGMVRELDPGELYVGKSSSSSPGKIVWQGKGFRKE